MFVVWFALSLVAAEEVPVSASLPAQVGLPAAAQLLEVRHELLVPDCETAGAEAWKKLEDQAKRKKLVLAEIYTPEGGLTPSRAVGCALQGDPKSPTGAVARVRALGVAPLDGAPSVDRARAVELAYLLGAAAGGGPEKFSVVVADGAYWLDTGTLGGGTKDPVAKDENTRGSELLFDQVLSWAGGYTGMLVTVPELKGVRGVFEVKLSAGKVKKELWQVSLPTAVVGPFLAGKVEEQVFADQVTVELGTGDKKAPWKKLSLDVLDEGSGAVSRSRETGGPAGEDLEDTPDPEPPKPAPAPKPAKGGKR